MKLSGREASRFVTAPPDTISAVLLYGADAMRVALKRQDLIKTLVGPNGEEEMRLTRIPAAELRKDPALIGDAMKAQGFFPGQRVAFVEDAGDSATKALEAALTDWREGDARIVVTAGSLAARSSLRKLFEGSKSAVAIGIYDDPPSRDEIEAELHKAGVPAPDRDAMAYLVSLSRDLDPGDLRQTLEKLALYKLNDPSPTVVEDIAAVVPMTIDADIDDILHVIAEARTAEIGLLMQRLTGQGVQPVGLCINAMRHFRLLFSAAAHPDGASTGITRVKPPVFGPRRDRMIRQAQSWGAAKLEQALAMLTETDLQLRSAGQRAPQMALVERTFIRLAMLAQR